MVVDALVRGTRRDVDEEVVREAGITSADIVVDLGAGSGALTAPLGEAARRVVAVEIDEALAAGLRGRFAAINSVLIASDDALSVAPPAEPNRVVASPPVANATSILRRLVAVPMMLRADVVVQLAAGRADRYGLTADEISVSPDWLDRRKPAS